MSEWIVPDDVYIDFQELIRCKDCKYYKVYEHMGHTLPLCVRMKTVLSYTEEDDYCSRAERKENHD